MQHYYKLFLIEDSEESACDGCRYNAITQALLNRPKLLTCDEPTSALDPAGRKEILDILLAAGELTIVLFSTHILVLLKNKRGNAHLTLPRLFIFAYPPVCL